MRLSVAAFVAWIVLAASHSSRTTEEAVSRALKVVSGSGYHFAALLQLARCYAFSLLTRQRLATPLVLCAGLRLPITHSCESAYFVARPVCANRARCLRRRTVFTRVREARRYSKTKAYRIVQRRCLRISDTIFAAAPRIGDPGTGLPPLSHDMVCAQWRSGARRASRRCSSDWTRRGHTCIAAFPADIRASDQMLSTLQIGNLQAMVIALAMLAMVFPPCSSPFLPDMGFWPRFGFSSFWPLPLRPPQRDCAPCFWPGCC